MASMPKITIYTTPFCPYCISAKTLLRRKNVAFEEIDVSGDPEGRRRMMERAHGRRTVPQIFIDEAHVGGSDELHDLDRQGQLDPLIAEA
jgi:glutaredoxin 3